MCLAMAESTKCCKVLANVDDIDEAKWVAAWTIELDRRLAEDHGGKSWPEVRAAIESAR
jgi:hypothetical protein